MGGRLLLRGEPPNTEGAADLASERDQHTKFFSLEQNEVPFWLLTATVPALLARTPACPNNPGPEGPRHSQSLQPFGACEGCGQLSLGFCQKSQPGEVPLVG